MHFIKEYALHVFTAATANNGKEACVGVVAAFIGIVAKEYLGGWDKGLQVLLLLMVADYATGLLGAFKTRTVNSDVMFWGGIRKIVVLFVIGVAVQLDHWIGNDSAVFRMAAIYFYGGREGLSVVENLGTLGVPLPNGMKRFLEQLHVQGGASMKEDGKP